MSLPARKLSLFFACGFAALLLLLCTVTAYASETVQQIPGPAGHRIWRITQPTVNKATTDYPQITFAPGETVTVSAVGCVQTGGSGHTWKRYVDPAGYGSGSNSELYHGKISIPGSTNGLVDFLPRQPTVYTIPANVSMPANVMHLQLGYVDDNYGDNGYYSRNSDNGNLDQCWGLGDASLTIDIGPIPATAPAPAQADYTFTIDSVMIRNTRSHHFGDDGKDSDVLGTAVMVNGTQSAIGGQGIGDDGRGNHQVNFPTTITQVQPTDRLNFAYTIVNAGDPSSQQTTTEVTGIIGKAVSIVPGFGSILSTVVTGLGELINIGNPDCDGPVVADAVMASGKDLAMWTQNGPYTRTMSFPGVNSATGCGSNSFYEVTYTIARSNAGPQPYSVQVNARSLASKLGSQTRVFRR